MLFEITFKEILLNLIPLKFRNCDMYVAILVNHVYDSGKNGLNNF